MPENAGSVRVIREDIKKENLLYLGCEFGAWVSADRGKTWSKFKNLPTVAVHEFAQHPRLDDMAIATHGRSLWVTDLAMLRQINPKQSENVLFEPREVISWQTTARRGSSGTRKFVAANAPIECRIEYHLAANARNLEIEIRDLKGDVVKRIDSPPTTKGYHSIAWNLRRDDRQRGRFGPRIATGNYLIVMKIGGETKTQTLSVVSDPDDPNEAVSEEDEFTWWMYAGGDLDK